MARKLLGPVIEAEIQPWAAEAELPTAEQAAGSPGCCASAAARTAGGP